MSHFSGTSPKKQQYKCTVGETLEAGTAFGLHIPAPLFEPEGGAGSSRDDTTVMAASN